jgi:DnaK suppressor protein
MDLEKYRRKLLMKKNELISETKREGVSARQEPASEAIEVGDKSIIDQSKDFLLTEADRDTELVHEIDAALIRIGKGTYGRCIECGKTIPEARLDAVPWTPYCAEHQRKHELLESPPPTL